MIPGEKREVMRMEQIWLFLTESSGWVLLLGIFSIIFPLIALHKIKGIERQLCEISGDVVETTAIMIHIAESMPGRENVYEKMSTSAGAAVTGQSAGGAESGQQAAKEQSEALINAVLGEVFP